MSDSQGPEPRDPWAPPEDREATGNGKATGDRKATDREATGAPGGRYDVPLPPPAPGAAGGYAPSASGVPPIPGSGAQPYGTAGYGAGGHGAGGYGWGGAPYAGGHPGPHPPPGYQPYWLPTGLNNGFGTAALILGILGTVLGVTVFFGFLLGVLAIVFGGVGRAKVTKGEADNGGTALAGIILGAVAVLLSVVMLGFIVASAADDPGYDDGPWHPGYSGGSGSGGSGSGGSGSGSDSDDDGPDTFEAAPAPGPHLAVF
ncbi:DUF4190 domain-containing protein [Streptomyces sp. NPDC007100]|uniref:DUF4190 domain-containing protein n=1 Tax=Streptomyces sp. NPDC007100 TaxID=3155602 RepID=UPI0033F5BCC3